MLDLRQVTLCCIDFKNSPQAINAFNKSKEGIEFGDYLFAGKDFNKRHIPEINSKKEYSEFIFKKLADYIVTRYVLIIQYDGYIINPQLWDNRFLDYDYIGAPWWYETKNVGNGGFSLRSLELLTCLKNSEFNDVHPEDDKICRTYYHQLKDLYNIKFAPEGMAAKFSYEPNFKYPDFKNNTFGFHGIPSLIIN